MHSLSEFGCIKDKRQFNEVASIYGSDMSAVYSGGLVYEYSVEGQGPEAEQAKYGLVKLENGKATPVPDFQTLKNAFQKTPIPTGDGGYKQNGKASECPTKSKSWNVTISANQLPAFPAKAKDYLKDGAGKAPGLKGNSQEAGEEPSLAGEASGAVTSGSSTSGSGSGSASGSQGAASSLQVGAFSMAPLVCGAVVLISSFLGGSLIL